MISEQQIATVLLAHTNLHDAGEALIAAANDAGGRDNITVILLRLEEVALGEHAPATQEHQTMVVELGAVEPEQFLSPPLQPPPVVEARRRSPRQAAAPTDTARSRKRLRRLGALGLVVVVLGVLGSAAYLALQSVYFIGTNSRGLVTLFQGVPYRLPGNIDLYASQYVSGVSASSLTAQRRHTLLDHTLRSEEDAASLIRSLELDQLE